MDTHSVMMAAAGFIGRRAADHDKRRIRRRRLAIDQPLRAAGLPRAATRVLAGCLEFCETVGVGGQQGHRSEGSGEEIQVEAGHDHVTAAISQVFNKVNYVRPEELCFVDADHPRVVSQLIPECRHVRDRDRWETDLAVRGDGFEGDSVPGRAGVSIPASYR